MQMNNLFLLLNSGCLNRVEEYNMKYVAFLDILGFKKILMRRIKRQQKILLYSFLERFLRYFEVLKGRQILK